MATGSALFNKRVKKELAELQARPPTGVSLKSFNDSLNCIIVRLDCSDDSVYKGESYFLRVSLDSSYPLSSPEVVFIETVPIHPHIYSNGHICLSILYDQWSPALTVGSVCLSILSMLSSCTKKVLRRICPASPLPPAVLDHALQLMVLRLLSASPVAAAVAALAAAAAAAVIAAPNSDRRMLTPKLQERPHDNDIYVATSRKSPKDTSWSFHDDSV
ncbi:hypothetical protein HK105_202826 [Polyrhizophydium stewartii]|uniref:UBC core domain-containing protein n=1 Tax=Polyrhizophydium stewartii TaxID=2732419 RepID=A0ABR4NDD7_9FUNG